MSSSQSEQCEASFFSVDLHQANLQPNLLLLGSCLRFNPTPTFLGVTFDRTLFFSKHVSSLKAKFFPTSQRLTLYHCFIMWAPLRIHSLFCIKPFFGPFTLMLHPDGFLPQALPISPNWNASIERPVVPSPAASHPPLSHFSSLKLLYLPYESP